MPDVTQYVQLGGQVVVVVLFLNYLSKRDDKLGNALDRLREVILQNTVAVRENKPVVSDNTHAVKKNTDTIKKTNGSGN